MFHSVFKKRFEEFTVTLRFSILSIFISFFIVILIVLMSIFYFHISELVHRAAFLLMRETSYGIIEELNLQLYPEGAASQLSAKNIRQQVIDTHDQKKMIAYIVHVLKGLPLAQGAYWSDVNGSFIFIRKNINGTFTAEIINRGVQPPTSNIIYLTNMHEEIYRKPGTFKFDPRRDPWFKASKYAVEPLWTDAFYYQYDPPFYGISVLYPAILDDGTFLGSFGVDVTLEKLTDFISKQKIGEAGEIFILNKRGSIIASSFHQNSKNQSMLNIKTLQKPWIRAAYKLYQNNKQSIFNFKFDGINYLASFKTIPILQHNDWVVMTVCKASDFTREINKLEEIYLIIYLIVFILGILLMSNLVTRIVNPIKKLVKETERIKHFNLKDTKKIFSHIKEVVELSNSIFSMKLGLRTFKRYVPAGLVRKLIQTGEGAQIGGTKKELVLFFSDIKNFTNIAEKSLSNELVQQVCDYFESLTSIIIKNHGTIDKYIGDSIMAFWGAPKVVERPCHHAAHAALKCVHQIKIINELWQLEKKPVFDTHIGIHYGEAIVGNIGSSERLNYTAVGDAVNIANRLVNVNKYYGTMILVSESVYQLINQEFVLRLVDHVTLKGKVVVTPIYELLAVEKNELNYDIDAYNAFFRKGFVAYQARQWQDAIEHFHQCLKVSPHDKLAIIFIKRCENFAAYPPHEDWKGIWQLSEK